MNKSGYIIVPLNLNPHITNVMLMILLFYSSQKDHIIHFLNFLNSQHPCIKFTYEVETDNTLPFLDINICRSNGSFLTSVYHKPLFTGLFTNFESFLPITYKKGLIYSLVFRYFNLSSSYILFHEELEKLGKFMKLNCYPDRFLDHCFKTFLNKNFILQLKIQQHLNCHFP